ncbi:MAG: gliding motility lipoprotein GldH [Bacteroidales bacterium]|nr:gliding motility lipoprotein GldH [Bacteroidales bacterium]
MRKFLLILTAAFLTVSCNRDRIYGEMTDIPDMVWDMNKIAKFEVPVEDINTPYNIKVELRVVDFYQFSNLYLFLRTESPSKKTLADTLECILYDDKGNSLTNSKMRFGELEDYEFTFKESVKFAEKGVYTFYIQHGMRLEQLPFVKEIGLTVEKLKE